MKKRVFIALNLTKVAKIAVAQILQKLKTVNPKPSIHYVKPDSVHLTLHFLGDRNPEEIERIKKILKSSARNYGSTMLITEKIDAFPNLKYPRVVFLTTREKNGNSLTNLQKQLGVELLKAGIDIDQRPWHPHLTLARLTGPNHFKTQAIKLTELEIPINSLELMESKLGVPGGQYKIIESYTLKS